MICSWLFRTKTADTAKDSRMEYFPNIQNFCYTFLYDGGLVVQLPLVVHVDVHHLCQTLSTAGVTNVSRDKCLLN